MTKEREALKLALEALCDIVEGSRLDAAGNRNDDGLLDHNGRHDYTKRVKAAQYAIASGKEALAQPVQGLDKAAIRANEREACVKFLECVDLGNLPPDLALHYALLINSLVAGIRARGNT